MAYLLKIIPTGKFGPRGEKYDIEFCGELIASGHAPECAACRELQKQGFTGMAYFTRGGAPYGWDFKMKIERAAGLTVSEGLHNGPRFTKWAPNPFFAKSEGLEEGA